MRYVLQLSILLAAFGISTALASDRLRLAQAPGQIAPQGQVLPAPLLPTPLIFDRSGIGPLTACTGSPSPGADSAAGAGPSSATASNSIDIVSDVHGLLGRLRYPSYELPKRLCCCRTYHGHPESRWQFALHSQLHDPTARLQTGVHQAAGAVNCHVPGPISRLAILLASCTRCASNARDARARVVISSPSFSLSTAGGVI
jgi:hypothetical protein